MGGGVVQDFTWAQVADQVRRMAAHLQAQGWAPGSKVAILSKNCAWWMMSDLAIWMAGYVSVPLYPTLAPETITPDPDPQRVQGLFVGKLDGWEHMKPGVPPGLPCISYPLSPDAPSGPTKAGTPSCARTAPMKDSPTRGEDELATLIYTSGTTGMPKGVMHSFGNFAWALDRGLKRIPLAQEDRMLSYLPLAHVVERMLVEHGWLRTGHARVLRRVAGHLRRRPAARPPHGLLLGAAPVGQVPAGHPPQDAAGQAEPAAGHSPSSAAGAQEGPEGAGPGPVPFAAGGAAPMPLALLQWYRHLGLPINEGYGMTENLALSHITEAGQEPAGHRGPGLRGRAGTASTRPPARCRCAARR
jgi:long-chain acyl-CoA synthetase